MNYNYKGFVNNILIIGTIILFLIGGGIYYFLKEKNQIPSNGYNVLNQKEKVNLLMESVELGDLYKVQELLKVGVDINARDTFGNSSLSIASEKGYLEIVQELIKSGAEINIKTGEEMTPLMLASEKGYLEIVQELIKSGAEIDEVRESGGTALIDAIYENHLEIVQELIKSGADVNKNTERGFTPIASVKSVEMARELIGSGADVNAMSHADFVKIENNIETRQWYTEETVLMCIAATEGIDDKMQRVKILQELANAGADVNAKNSLGDTALMYAHDYPESVNELIKLGADVNAKNNDGKTALMYASSWLNLDSVKMLINAGTDVNAKDNNGWTALTWVGRAFKNVADEDKSDIIKELKNAGAKGD